MGGCYSNEDALDDREFNSFLRAEQHQRGPVNPLFARIIDQFQSYEEVISAMRGAGLESSNLVVGIDYTKSNTWTGKNTFQGMCLHQLQHNIFNPYQSVIHIMGKTLAPFDDDNLIPVFGFGDLSTVDKAVFPFFPDRPCNGFEEVLQRYNEITPSVVLAGPTSFAPLIRETMKIVQQSRSYHILIIVADGQVTSPHETRKAIVEASNYPISIILIGVGDGPWDLMEEFDDGLPQRQFDNFQFVNYFEVMTRYEGSEPKFALLALQEIPEQYKSIKRLGMI
jgi:hypothetical protein